MDGGREKTRFCGFVWEEKEKEKEREWREEEEGEEEGEVVMGKVENVRYWPISLSVSSPSSSVLVQLKISNFRIRVVGSVQLSFYLGDVERYEIHERGSSCFLSLYFRNLELEVFEFPKKDEKKIQNNFINYLMHTKKTTKELFAFQHYSAQTNKKQNHKNQKQNSYQKNQKINCQTNQKITCQTNQKKQKPWRDIWWFVFNMKSEFERMSLGSQWSLTGVNRHYKMCEEYPQYFYVPSNVTETDLYQNSSFRIRVPVLCWKSPKGIICRASSVDFLVVEDMVGMMMVQILPDERLMKKFQQASNSKQFWILSLIDGEEKIQKLSPERYPNCVFCSQRMASKEEISQLYTGLQTISPSSSRCTFKEKRDKMSQNGWYQNLDQLLGIVTKFAKKFYEESVSFLIQSSDGDNLSALVSSLIQLLLDPYYRTMRGFCVLVEKEWMYLGHKFCDFVKPKAPGIFDAFFGEKEKEKTNDVIWVLFLDAVSQLLQISPQFFEFEENFLGFILEHTFSCRFGNFLSSCEKERHKSKVVEMTASIWGYLMTNRKQFLNPLYQPKEYILDSLSFEGNEMGSGACLVSF